MGSYTPMTDHDFDSRAFYFPFFRPTRKYWFLLCCSGISLSLFFFFLEPFKSSARRYQGSVFSGQVNFRSHIYNPLSISGNPMSAIGSDVGRRLGLRTYTASLKLKKASSFQSKLRPAERQKK